MELLVTITDIATRQSIGHYFKAGESVITEKTTLDLYNQFLALLNEKDLLPELSERNHYAGCSLGFKYNNGNFVSDTRSATRLRFYDTNYLIDCIKSDFLLARLILIQDRSPDIVYIEQVSIAMAICPYTSYDFGVRNYKEGNKIVLTFSRD